MSLVSGVLRFMSVASVSVELFRGCLVPRFVLLVSGVGLAVVLFVWSGLVLVGGLSVLWLSGWCVALVILVGVSCVVRSDCWCARLARSHSRALGVSLVLLCSLSSSFRLGPVSSRRSGIARRFSGGRCRFPEGGFGF
jgi:hypothetical protein